MIRFLTTHILFFVFLSLYKYKITYKRRFHSAIHDGYLEKLIVNFNFLTDVKELVYFFLKWKELSPFSLSSNCACAFENENRLLRYTWLDNINVTMRHVFITKSNNDTNLRNRHIADG